MYIFFHFAVWRPPFDQVLEIGWTALTDHDGQVAREPSGAKAKSRMLKPAVSKCGLNQSAVKANQKKLVGLPMAAASVKTCISAPLIQHRMPEDTASPPVP